MLKPNARLIKSVLVKRLTLVVSVTAIVLSLACWTQEQPTSPNNQSVSETDLQAPAGGDTTPTSPLTYDQLLVVKVQGPATNEARFSDIITVKVRGLSKWTQQSGNDPKQFELYLNGNLLSGLHPKTDRVFNDELQFVLKLTPDSQPTWRDVFNESSNTSPNTILDKWTMARRVRVTVGIHGAAPIHSEGEDIYLVIASEGNVFLLLIWVLISILMFFYFGRRTNLLRANYIKLTSSEIIGRRPFSLGHVQAAWWQCLTVLSLGGAWLTSGTTNISSSILVLLAISFVTALVAAWVEISKRNVVDGHIEMLNSEESKINRHITSIQSANSLKAGSENHENRIRQLEGLKSQQEFISRRLKLIEERWAPHPSRGFILDVISDAEGVRFSKVQFLICTVLLGLYYAYAFIGSMLIPEFSWDSLLLLTISAGIYIGFKLLELIDVRQEESIYQRIIANAESALSIDRMDVQPESERAEGWIPHAVRLPLITRVLPVLVLTSTIAMYYSLRSNAPVGVAVASLISILGIVLYTYSRVRPSH
jgi:hypothetical protein